MITRHDVDIDEALKTAESVHGRAGEIELPMLLLYAGADRIVSADATDRFAGRLPRAGRKSHS